VVLAPHHRSPNKKRRKRKEGKMWHGQKSGGKGNGGNVSRGPGQKNATLTIIGKGTARSQRQARVTVWEAEKSLDVKHLRRELKKDKRQHRFQGGSQASKRKNKGGVKLQKKESQKRLPKIEDRTKERKGATHQ